MEKKLIKQIRRLCEKQYRKGFQHGYMACDKDLLSPQQASLFHIEGEEQGYKQMRNPFTNQIRKYMDIPSVEVDDMVEIDSLLACEYLIITEDKAIDLIVEKLLEIWKGEGLLDIG
tara:strand:+ start:178 stop:525 length:348 start_codon:yes stop_codon:yes gene_type:complete